MNFQEILRNLLLIIHLNIKPRSLRPLRILQFLKEEFVLPNLLIMTLQTKQITITITAFEGFVTVFFPYILLNAVLLILIQKRARLRLEILNTEIWCQYIFCELLLQLLFDLLSKSLVHKRILGVKLGEDDYLKTPDNPLFCQFQCFLNL